MNKTPNDRPPKEFTVTVTINTTNPNLKIIQNLMQVEAIIINNNKKSLHDSSVTRSFSSWVWTISFRDNYEGVWGAVRSVFIPKLHDLQAMVIDGIITSINMQFVTLLYYNVYSSMDDIYDGFPYPVNNASEFPIIDTSGLIMEIPQDIITFITQLGIKFILRVEAPDNV